MSLRVSTNRSTTSPRLSSEGYADPTRSSAIASSPRRSSRGHFQGVDSASCLEDNDLRCDRTSSTARPHDSQEDRRRGTTVSSYHTQKEQLRRPSSKLHTGGHQEDEHQPTRTSALPRSKQGNSQCTASIIKIREGTAVRVFSSTEDAWLQAVVVDVFEDDKVRVEYQSEANLCAKTLSIHSDRLDFCNNRRSVREASIKLEADHATDEENATDDSLPDECDPEVVWECKKRPKKNPDDPPVKREVDLRPPPQDELAVFVRAKYAEGMKNQKEICERAGAQTYSNRIHENNPMSTTIFG